MPKPGKSTKFAKFIASKVSSDMRFPILPSIFPAISTYLACVSFIYSDNKKYEMCGQMNRNVRTDEPFDRYIGQRKGPADAFDRNRYAPA